MRDRTQGLTLGFRRLVFTCLLLATYSATAQGPTPVTGYNAVFPSSGGTPVPSAAFIDASVSQKVTGNNLCLTIYNIFLGNPPGAPLLADFARGGRVLRPRISYHHP
jgi:hypothetical protein